jgi:GDP-4-dehydro-6-deoxy-D-mannose reductase
MAVVTRAAQARYSRRMPGGTRVLITGAAGFAGSHLSALLETGGSEITSFSGDIRDLDVLREEIAAAQPTAIAHLAGLASVAQAWGAERGVWDVNATGTLNLLLAARDAAPAARVLIVSSAEVYGSVPESRHPIDEDEPLAPLSPYGVSKVAAELVAAQSPLDVAIARPFNHLGPGQDTRFAIPSFCAQIASIERGTQPARIEVGNLSARRDFSDVRDVVEAYNLLLRPGGPRGPFNIASGEAHAIGEILERLLALARVTIEVSVDEGRLRPSDVPALCGDATRLRDATGWAPSHPFERTLADTLEYYRALGELTPSA